MTGSVGGQVRYLRKLKGLKMAELAALVDCTESFISKIESGRARPSLNMLHRIAQALDANMSQMFSPIDKSSDIVLRAADRLRLSHWNGDDKISVERMIAPDPGVLLQGHLHHLEPGGASEGTITHLGEEFGYVLEGKVELTVEEFRFELAPGDSFHFKSERPHGYRNIGQTPARILWINTPPTY